MSIVPCTPYTLEVDPDKIDDCNAPHLSKGRPCYTAYRFQAPHPLYKCFVLREKAKYAVPVLTGDPPPRLPERVPGQRSVTAKTLVKRSAYYCVLFIPWHAGEYIDLSVDRWNAHVHALQANSTVNTFATDSDDTALDKATAISDIRQGRLWRIKQVATALATSASKATVMAKWRSRNRDIWNPDEHKNTTKSGMPGQEDTRALEQEIDALQNANKPRHDLKTISRAAAAEHWVDELVAALAKAQGSVSNVASLPQWDARAPVRSGALTFVLRGGATQVQDVLLALKNPRINASTSMSDVVAAGADSSIQLAAVEHSASSVLFIPAEFEEISEAAFLELQATYKRDCDQTGPSTSKVTPPLNPEQRTFARQLWEAMRILKNGRVAGEERAATLEKLRAAGLPQVFLLQGAGGVGKTVLLHALQNALHCEHFGTMALTAWTGVAAAPFRAPTLCSLLGIDFAHLRQEPRCTEQQIAVIRTEYAKYFGEPADLLIFVIDEVSFLDPAALHWVDMLLRAMLAEPEVPFGGVLILLAGDFWQKPPPRGTSLAELLVSVDAPIRKTTTLSPTSSAAKGLDIFRQARRSVLMRQMRAAEDAQFQKTLLQVRSTDAEPPIPAAFINSLKTLSPSEVSTAPERAFAPILVLSNQERLRLNQHQAIAFAKMYSLPLVRWQIPLAGNTAAAISESILPSLYENEVGLYHYFVRGAPCMLLRNIQPTKALANGSMGWMHSLSFSHVSPKELSEAEARGGFCIVDLTCPPLSINFVPALPDDDTGEGIESIDKDTLVVPIVASPELLEYATTSLFAVMHNVPAVLRHNAHPLTLAFAMTDFKVQGRTLNYVNLSIASRPFPPHLDMKGFYVMISRVRCSAALRVLSKHDNLRHLFSLRHAPELAVWHAAYTDKGDWDAGAARKLSQIAVTKRPQPKRRAYNSQGTP